MTDQSIEINNVHKAYGALHVLRGINLQVAPGEAFALLGPNGAGKTTLNHTILGLLKPDHGSVRVLGSTDPARISNNLGYLPERQRYHPHFTGREYVTTLGKLSSLHGQQLAQQVAAVLQAMNLGEAANRRLGTYSKGMLQRIGLAQAVLHNPNLLIIDEPTSGLDPGGQGEMIALLRQLRQAGHTIFMCTHQLAHVASLCDRVGVLVDGQINHIAGVAELEAQGHSVMIDVADLPLDTAQTLQALGPQVRCERTGVTLFPSSDALVATVLRHLLDDGVAVRAVTPQADALEQFYRRAVEPEHEQPHPPAPLDRPQAPVDTLVEDR
jgi:ABC-2 type transport system ATP-binding protein